MKNTKTNLRLKPIALFCMQLMLALPATTLVAHANETTPASAPVAVSALQSGMDKTVAPGDDFYRYVNGGWEKTAVIPNDKSAVGVTSTLKDESDAIVLKLIEQAAQAPADSPARKVGDYYAAYLNTDAINQRGLQAIAPQLHSIASISNKSALATYLGKHLRADVDPLNATSFFTENLFGLWVAQGFHDHTKYTGYLLQGGLGLPDREYYLSASPKMANIRTEYQAHIAALFKLANIAEPEQAAKRVFDLEMRIAQGHAKRSDSSDMDKADNSWSRAAFAKQAPGLDWNAYFSAAGLAAQPSFIVWHPTAFKSSAALVASTPLETWKDYLRFHALNQHTSVLPQAFFDQKFKFSSSLTGAKAPLPRWKYAVNATNSALGEEVGKLYVAQNFSPEAKAKINTMVSVLLTAFKERVSNISWMSASTKQEALAKINSFYVGVGYPDKWRDYSALTVDAKDAFGNGERAQEFAYKNALAKFGKPVDVTEWCMTPQTVNAVNMPMQNAINFPAAYLQFPNFDINASDAVNYGAIGSTIGHEISHSFDHTGAMIDAKGELRNWWTKDDLSHFQTSAKALADQFSSYKPFPDLAVNGEQTLDENIADLTGLMAAFDAYHAAMKQKGQTATKETDQEFFLANAYKYRGKMRDEVLRSAIIGDGHAPGHYRALTVRNLDAWYDGFNIQPGQQLYLAPNERVKIW
ncbi:M13 family metallopeptidase [Solimicrobium silvestre]|uniref:Putative metalloendopeptidase n=1 Tax=Solimicrobium silvestre TaxID=2099400 RepID=A0A2S9H3V0_9BURK|nr:M13 family metallopeptidase [Solimicrobium silvestre]PRC94546.1 putative metalloendopeptidase [Solimicrobium silvestre]